MEKMGFLKKEGGHALAFIIFFVLTAAVFGIDQLTKYWIVSNFYPGESLPLLGELLYLTYVRNPGAAFGLFAYKTHFFIIISGIMIILMVIGAFQIPPRLMLLRLGMAVVLGGILGNLYDRIQTGYVVDFLDLRFWPVFNIADLAIVLGVIMFAIGLSFSPREAGPAGSARGGS